MKCFFLVTLKEKTGHEYFCGCQCFAVTLCSCSYCVIVLRSMWKSHCQAFLELQISVVHYCSACLQCSAVTRQKFLAFTETVSYFCAPLLCNLKRIFHAYVFSLLIFLEIACAENRPKTVLGIRWSASLADFGIRVETEKLLYHSG